MILDEPTIGVDPLSRRQFWKLIDRIRSRRRAMSIGVATAYMEEAEQFDWLVAMNAGRVLAAGAPAQLRAQTGTRAIEDARIHCTLARTAAWRSPETAHSIPQHHRY